MDTNLSTHDANPRPTSDADARQVVPGLSFVFPAFAMVISVLFLFALLSLVGCQAPPAEPDVPAGSLRVLAEAAEQGDWGTMLQYMDPKAIGIAFAQATIGRLESGEESDAPGSSPGAHSDGAFIAGPMVTGFTESFVTNLSASVESGTVLAEGKLLRVILDDGVGDTEFVSDREALVSVVIPGEGEGAVVRLRMVRDGDHWKLVSVEDTMDIYELLF